MNSVSGAMFQTSQYPDARFLFLTNQEKAALKLIKENPIASKSIVMSVEPQDIGAYLSASDVAMIIREPHPLNYGASPVKVAEYINNGLPLIISDAIKDYSRMVKESGTGLVLSHPMLSDKKHLQSAFEKLSQDDWENQRNRYETRLVEVLTKNYSVSKLLSIYEKLAYNA